MAVPDRARHHQTQKSSCCIPHQHCGRRDETVKTRDDRGDAPRYTFKRLSNVPTKRLDSPLPSRSANHMHLPRSTTSTPSSPPRRWRGQSPKHRHCSTPHATTTSQVKVCTYWLYVLMLATGSYQACSHGESVQNSNTPYTSRRVASHGPAPQSRRKMFQPPSSSRTTPLRNGYRS